MNTTTTPTNLRRVIATAIFSALASGGAADCTAAGGTDAPQAIVKYGDLNIASPQGAAALYTRIRAAAEQVCRSFDRRGLASKELRDTCIHKAIADAVTKVDQPALFAVYSAKNRTSQFLTTDRRVYDSAFRSY